MTKLTNTLASTAAGLLLIGSLAGCAGDDSKTDTTTDASAPATTAEATTETTTESTSGGNTTSGEALKPGDKTTGSGIVPFVNYDDETADFEHQLVSVEKAPQADVDAIVAEIPEVAGMDVYYLVLDSHYVSGANLEHDSFSTDFHVVDASGKRTQEISLIGWDNCESNSIPRPGDDPNTKISNCFAAAAAPGGNAPAGLAWDAYGSEYEDNPAYFYLP